MEIIFCAEKDGRDRKSQAATLQTGRDLHNIRQGKNLGHKVNQKLHELPYENLVQMLEYKLKLYGIRLVKQE